MLVLIVIIISTSQVLAEYEPRFNDPIFPQCIDDNNCITYKLGSMTPYHPPQKTCSPSRALCMMRHGAKYPKEKVQDGIKKLEIFQNHFNTLYSDTNKFKNLSNESKTVIQQIMKWKNKTSSATAKEINDRGLLSIKMLAERWNSKLLNIVVNIEKEEDIEYNSATEKRCKDSGNTFLREFFKIKNKEIFEKFPDAQLPKEEDYRIKLDKGKPQEKDPKGKSSEEDVEDIYFNKVCPEENCYLKTKICNLLYPFKSMDSNTECEEIKCATIKSMYLACANSYVYDYSEDEEGHAWCSLFDNDDIIMFEGMYDFQYYIKNGYHDKKIKNYGHPLMKDIVKFLQEPDPKIFKLFSGHTSNCLSLVTGFRMFQDERELTLENMTEGDKMSKRKWKSSLIGNYACHVMVVVYDCMNDKHKKIPQEVSIFYNETPLEMVFENKRTCTQCPINDVINLINHLLKDTPTVNKLNENANTVQ